MTWRVRDAALADAASFTPHLLVEGGPDNLRVAVPGAREALTIDGVQLSYGAQSRVESLLTTARVTGRPALSTLAGIAGSWYFGNNPAGAPMYDPATGRTYDGVDIPDAPPQQMGRRGVVHRDAGAESTIHGLLAMLALDANRAPGGRGPHRRDRPPSPTWGRTPGSMTAARTASCAG